MGWVWVIKCIFSNIDEIEKFKVDWELYGTPGYLEARGYEKTKGIYNRLALIICLILDIDMAL